jgi:ATP-dependent DNA ligase
MHWIHEIKHDGYRTQLVIERGKCACLAATDMIGGDRYPSIARADCQPSLQVDNH